MNFDSFFKQAWADHAKEPQAVADRLPEGLAALEKNDQIPLLANLATHVFGEHLGKWNEGLSFLKQLKASPLFVRESESEKAIARFIAVLELCGGNESADINLSISDKIRVYAIGASALNEQKQPERAQKFFQKSLELAQLHLKKEDPANRALAVTGNSLACTLEEKQILSAADIDLMILAAQTGRKYWEIAGTWLEVERAEYRLSQTYLKAGRTSEALQHAQRCIEISKQNNAPALELFFGFEALALVEKTRNNQSAFSAALESAQHYFDLLNPDDKSWCAKSLSKLQEGSLI